jgi:hypothetical protein
MTKDINLYWVSTGDNSEDWFIFAKTERDARRYHSDYEGFDTIRGITAELIIEDIKLPKLANGEPPVHAPLPDLKKLGFTILDPNPNQRAVRLAGRAFVEGIYEAIIMGSHDDAFESSGNGRPNRTVRQTRPN